MKISKEYSPYLIAVLLCFLAGINHAQEIEMTFDGKDLEGNIMPIVDHLDSDKNHLILFSAFWCSPCVKAINDTHSKMIELYREQYNLEVVILDDENYSNPSNAINKIKKNQWYFKMLLTDDHYGEVGINAIPRYYFLPAGEETAWQISRTTYLEDIEAHYLEEGIELPFDKENRQIITSQDCDQVDIIDYGSTSDSLINDNNYKLINGNYYCTGILNRNIYRYEPLLDSSIIVFDYTLDACDQFTLRDHQGDEKNILIDRVTKEGDEIILETDAMILNACGNDIPFVLSSKYGSNAGLVFDIENEEIVSKLVCHQRDGESLFFSHELEAYCQPSSTADTEDHNIELTNNPGNGLFTIKGLDIEDDYTIHIYSPSGTLEQNTSDSQIDIRSLVSGFYIISISNDKGERIGSVKYVKE